MLTARARLLSYPYYLVIDPSNICNLKCPLCPTWHDVKRRPKGKMTMKMFKEIIDEVGPFLFMLNLCNWGEPLLNPDFIEMIRYAKSYNIVVGFSTNLNYLPDAMAEKLVDSGVDLIVLSVDGVTQETYSAYRTGGNLETVMANIKKIQHLKAMKKETSGTETFSKETLGRDKLSKGTPDVAWQYIVNRHNENEVEIAKKLASQLGLILWLMPIRTAMDKELTMPLYERVNETKDWLPHNPAYNRYAYEILPETKTKQSFCKWLWNASVVNWDGSISPCCAVYDKKWDFGSYIYTGRFSFHRTWNSSSYILARRLIASFLKGSVKSQSHSHKCLYGNLYGKEAEDKSLICKHCTKYGFLES
ncbi:MAG: radical SAM protein [Nitrospirae bacterium]|nr:radical SAM protein [Nitrospirota bacterium]